MQQAEKDYSRSLLSALSATAVICFWVMYGTLGYYNRFAADDYSMVALGNHRGLLGGTKWFYFNWSGGVFGTFFQTATVLLFQTAYTLLWYHLFLLLVFSASVFLLASEFNLRSKLQANTWQVFWASQLFIQLIFFSGFCISENWFWVVGSTGYVYALCFIFTSVAFFLRYERTGSYPALAVACVAAFCCGSYPVNFVLFYFSLAGLYFLYRLYLTRKVPAALLAYMVILVAGVALNIAAPGNYKRMLVTAGTIKNHIPFLYQFTHHPIIILKKSFSPYNLLLGIIFCFPVVALITGNAGFRQAYSRGRLLLVAAGTFVAYLGAALSNMLINYKALEWSLGSDRSMLHISVIIAVFLVCCVVVVYAWFNYANWLTWLSVVLLLACSYRSISTLRKQYPIVKQYALKHDERTRTIYQAKQSFTGTTLYLDSLPPSGILFSAEMSRDTNHYINIDMKDRFDLPFNMAVK